MSLTGNGLIVIPISTATACGLSIGNKVRLSETKIINTKNYMKKINKKLILLINYIENVLRDNVIDKKEFESLCNFFTKYVDEKT